MNETRADWAEQAVRQFGRDKGNDSVGQALRDLLCDTVHLAHRLGLRPENLFQNAISAAEEEEAEDGGRVRFNPSLEDQKP
jgi:phage terminase small subunit